ncbi:DMT family transporter [Pseudomonas sp. LRF_L74]|uniref:DMT family transporter n=1 Tax=Pseudomonas sp. LRF_L74 TaxID=3369422 RepID=UPI003F62FD32
MNTQRTHIGGIVPFVTGNLLLGSIGLFVHEAGVDPLTTTWFRCAFGLLGLSLWLLWRGRLSDIRLTRANAPRALLAGSLMVMSWVLFFSAMQYLAAGVAVVLFHVQPLWLLLLGAFWLKEAVAGRRVVCVLIAMFGLVLATGTLERLFDAQPARAGYWWGVLLCMLGALCTAWVTILAKGLRDIGPGVLAWWQCLIGGLVLLAWPLMHGWPEWGASWLWLSGLGLIHTGVAYTLMYAGITRLSTDRIAVLQFIYPAVAIVVDWLAYGERLGLLQMAGVGLMAACIWVAERPARRSAVTTSVS